MRTSPVFEDLTPVNTACIRYAQGPAADGLFNVTFNRTCCKHEYNRRFLRFVVFTGLFNKNHMQFRIEQQEGGTPEPSLADMTEKAIRILQREESKGYFLLVEGDLMDLGR